MQLLPKREYVMRLGHDVTRLVVIEIRILSLLSLLFHCSENRTICNTFQDIWICLPSASSRFIHEMNLKHTINFSDRICKAFTSVYGDLATQTARTCLM